MPKKGAKVATPASKDSKTSSTHKNPLIEKRPRNFGIGNDIQPTRDLSRFVRWPKYVKLQRQRRILLQRLKVPPTINQFTKTLDKASATQLFKLLSKYRPESRIEKRKRLLSVAEAKKENKDAQAQKKPLGVAYGVNNVTSLVEDKKAQLVVIAHDVNPIELVVWLPTLCRKMDIPYCIVKGKARLGALVHQKTATAVALTNINAQDKAEFTTLQNLAKDSFNNNSDVRKTWGGAKLGPKSTAALRKKEKAIAKEKIAQ